MPVTRLFPLATDVSGSIWAPFGVSPAHVGLSDASDSTGCRQFMSQFEPVREVHGSAMTQLPAASGVVKQLTLGYRTDNDNNGDACTGYAQLLYSGTPIITVNAPGAYPVTPTTLTAVGGPQPFAKINALTWSCRADFLLHDGMVVSAYELWLDVEWYPITGFQALIY